MELTSQNSNVIRIIRRYERQRRGPSVLICNVKCQVFSGWTMTAPKMLCRIHQLLAHLEIADYNLINLEQRVCLVSAIDLLKNDWSHSLADLIQSSEREIVISSPFVTREGVNFILNRVNQNFQAQGTVTFVTNLTTINLIQGATDPTALYHLVNQLPSTHVYHLPRLHAKTYIADSNKAIITSGNLTSGGLIHNYEYGVWINDEQIVSGVRADIMGYAQLGAKISKESLLNYCKAVEQAKEAFKHQQSSISRSARQQFDEVLQAANDELMRLRLSEGPIHTVFEKTVLFLLQQHGSLTTVQLHSLIKTYILISAMILLTV